MPKSQLIDPGELLRPGSITFSDIPVNRYSRTAAQELEAGVYTQEELLRVYRDMLVIRTFEEMLHSIKVYGHYRDHRFTYTGPAHLSIGEEAYAVAQAYVLDENDFIFGGHRGHHEIIAKGLSCIRKLGEERLEEIMTTFAGGRQYAVVKEHGRAGAGSLRALAEDFFLYGVMAEIFAKVTGFSKGLGGSMHAFFVPFGIYPNNAIVGASACTAAGAGLFKKCNRKPGVVVANLGDGSLACGPVWESINFAAMDQYRSLWGEGFDKGGLPVLFNFANNGYGMGGQTRGETMAYDYLARFAAGVAPGALHVARVNGLDPLAAIDAYRRARDTLLAGEGPVLLDMLTYRLTGHSTSDIAPSYRTKEELSAWRELDSIRRFGEQLVLAGVCSPSRLEEIRTEVEERNLHLFLLACDSGISPLADLSRDPGYVEDILFSGGREERLDSRAPEVLIPRGDNPRVKQLKQRSRTGIGPDGKPLSPAQAIQIRDALFEALLHRYYEDPTMVSYAEDVRDWGGSYGVYRGLTESLPYHRLFNMPISEAAMVGSAVGYAMAGGRAVVELMFADFLGRAGDEVFNQMAKWQAMSGGNLRMPVVLRAAIGSKYGAQHSQDWAALPAHIPGLKVVMPATPYDAKGLMNAALAGTDPVVFFECQRIYDMGERFHPGGVPEGYYEVPIGLPDIKRVGSDITILTAGATLYRAVEAADILVERFGLSAEIIDARSIVPFDYEPVLESVRKTGRIVLAGDACARGSVLANMAQNITRFAFDSLDAPPVVVGARNWITPAFEYDKEFSPQATWIIDAIHENILPLPGYAPTTAQANPEMLRREKWGV